MNAITFDQLNDTQKQNLASAMLDIHPTRSANCVVEYILGKSVEDSEAPFSRDDITNNEYYGSVEITTITGATYWEDLEEEERDEKLELFEHLRDRAERVIELIEDNPVYSADELNHWEQIRHNLQTTVDELGGMSFDEKKEIYQWFSCSDWLIYKLEEHGQCTLDGEYWGRQCCGQSIVLDHVIQCIAFEWFSEYNTDYIKEGTAGWDIVARERV